MSEQKERAASVSVLTTMGAVAGLAIGLMCAWGGWFVRSWAHEKNASGEEVGYGVPGTFGDAFAPVVGVLTSLALGAAVASVLMQRRELELQREEMQLQRDEMKAQREEMEEARKQWTAQAASMAEANQYAKHANVLAENAQRLEAWRQLLEIDEIAIREIERDRKMRGLGEQFDYSKDWYEYLEATPPVRTQRGFDTPRMRALVSMREKLSDVALVG